MCLVRYSLFANLVHPDTRCSTVSEFWLRILHLPSSINPLASFHDLVFTICSKIVMIAAAFPELRLWDNHTWHSCSYSLYNLLCCSFLPYSSILCFFILFFSFSFSFFPADFPPSSISSPSIWMLPYSNWISTSTSPIVFIASSTMEFSSLMFSLLHAALIHLFSKQVK